MNVPVFLPLSRWPRVILVAVGEAHRRNCAEGIEEPEAWQSLRRAFLEAGGDPADASFASDRIVAELARAHGDWLWAPARRQLAREAELGV